jgi:KTSC domain
MPDGEGDLSWVAAASRTVAHYAYQAEQTRLHIEFRNGDIGYYTQVPRPLFEAFEAALSKGTFIRLHLKSNPSVPWVKVSYAPRRRASSAEQKQRRHAPSRGPA